MPRKTLLHIYPTPPTFVNSSPVVGRVDEVLRGCYDEGVSERDRDSNQ